MSVMGMLVSLSYLLTTLATSAAGGTTANIKTTKARVAIVGERDYTLTCVDDDIHASLQWKKASHQKQPVVNCSPTKPVGHGQVCVAREKGKATLRFGKMTFESAGVFVCCWKDAEDVDVIGTVNVTVIAAPTDRPSRQQRVRSSGRNLHLNGVTGIPPVENQVLFVSDEPRRTRDSHTKGVNYTQIGLIAALICVSVIMTVFWLAMTVLCCRRYCQQKRQIYDSSNSVSSINAV